MKRPVAAMLAFLICFPLTVSADSLYIRKIVSVVYDDSGSMMNNGSANWAYASYAMQAFCGLLNSDDQLYITYMSEAEKNSNLNPPGIDLSASSIQSSVDSIRKHTAAGNTPYSAVDIAFNKLKSVQDSNVNTQYWLVVITDGEFQNLSGGAVTVDDLNSKLSTFSTTTMPNGSLPQITYLAIGDNAAKPDNKPNNGIYAYESAGASDIVNVMSQIADKVSGRSRLNASDLVKKNSNTIEITSAVPLLNIAVLSQKTSAKISNVSYSSGGQLDVSRSVSISYPEHSGWTTDTSLNGSAFLITNQSGNIDAGTYSIQFSSDISLDDVVIMFEPALEIRMTVSRNGVEVSDLSELSSAHEGDKIDVSCKIYEIGTDNEISPSLLPGDTTYNISFIENGSVVEQSNSSDLSLKGIVLHNCPTEMTASIVIKGFNPITSTSGVFTPNKAVIYTISVEQPVNFSLTMDDLKTNTDKIRFVVYADGIAVTSEEAKTLPFSIDTRMPGKITYEDDGSISFTPIYQDPITAIPTGDVEVTGVLKDIASVTTSFYLKPIEYTVKAIEPNDKTLIRTDLKDNSKGISFEIFADGKKLDKEAIEAAEIEYKMNDPYAEKFELDISVDSEGTITAIPKCDKWEWLATYSIQTGTLEISAACNGVSDFGTLDIGKDSAHELIFNIVIPGLILLFILGHIIKRRFKYSAKIHYNFGEGSGSMITGPKSGWNTQGLFTLTALIPFVPDSKTVNGARFYAKGFMWNPTVISVKPSRCPEASGTLDGGLNELESVRFGKSDVNGFEEGEKRRDMIYGNALITSGDRNLKSCQIYLYSDK